MTSDRPRHLAAGSVATEETRRRQMARDVRRSLSDARPGIPCKYLYDDRGSALFEAITRLPEYYQTRTEEAILAEQGDAIVARARPHELVELGSGAGRKVGLLLDALERADLGERLVLFDINEAMIDESARRLARERPHLTVRGAIGQFPEDLPLLGPGGDRLVLLLGGTIGNLPPDQVPGFLRQVAAQLAPGDGFLVGLDLVKDAERLEAAYNDSAGVTAAFNLNLLRVLNRELDADFDLDAFEHLALWEPGPDWIRIAVRSRREQVVHLPGIDMELHLQPGDEIQTEVSCKYTRASLAQRLAGTGLVLDDWFTDADEDFALALLKRPHEGALA